MVTVPRILPALTKDHQQITVALLLPKPGRLKRRREPNDYAFLGLPWSMSSRPLLEGQHGHSVTLLHQYQAMTGSSGVHFQFSPE